MVSVSGTNNFVTLYYDLVLMVDAVRNPLDTVARYEAIGFNLLGQSNGSLPSHFLF